MDKAGSVVDSSEQTPPSTLAPPPAAPVRRRSKLACDTCHYRKIKCDVEKGHPCKNCEKSAVQCTLVGPSMRPPRNLSGSSSAAAAAAVAVAVATAAAANAHTVPGKAFNGPTLEGSHSGDQVMAWSAETEQQSKTTGLEQESNAIRLPGLLVRRASVSGQTMRVDDDETSTDDTKAKRSLLSSSSSPTSLRALFNAGAASDPSSSTLDSSQSSLHTTTVTATSLTGTGKGHGSVAASDTHMDLNISSSGFDYFDHPIAFSSGSSTTSSTPSGAVLANGLAHLTYPIDTASSTVAHLLSPLSSPLCLAQSSSLPPTPMHIIADRLPESVIAGASSSSTGRYPSGHTQFHPSAPHSRHSTPRRASSSSFLPSQLPGDNDIRSLHHDRRTSAPWAGYPHSHSHSQPSHYESRHTGPTGVHGLPYSASIIHSKKHYATTDDIQPYPSSQSALMRSNSTPAALRSPLKSLTRNRHSALPSRRSHIGPTRHSMNLYASTDKVIQDLSLPQQLYRHSALPQRHNNSLSHLQFQLHLQQMQHSQQSTQRSQSLPRFQRDASQLPPLQQHQQQCQPWQGFPAPHLHQESDRHFDAANSSSTRSAVGEMALNPTGLSVNESDGSLDIRATTDILSPVGVHSPIQADTTEFQSFASQMTTAYDPTLTEDADYDADGLAQNVLKAQQQDHQPLPLPTEEPTTKLQFADGYAWGHDEASTIVQGHTRHQSASQVYPQQQQQHSMQFRSISSSSSSSAQQKTFLTRSLQDLSHYSATMNDQQHRLAEQVRRLQEEAVGVHPPQPSLQPTSGSLEQGMGHDMFGASLALVLDDHLRLLDDMDVVPELNEYDEMAQSSLDLSSSQMSKDRLLQRSDPTIHSGPQESVSTTGGTLTQETSCSIFDAIARSATNVEDSIFLGGGDESYKDLSSSMIHFQSEPYIDSLSFLDLSGTYMPSTPSTITTATSTLTSSSLPNTSFLDQQSNRFYHGLLPSLEQQQPAPAQQLQQLQQLQPAQEHSSGVNNPLGQAVLQDCVQVQQQQQHQPQQHIIHHEHHHHHHVHLH
ncbi:hypothetical protein BGX28_004592 [Mortierella sp. GBA30]|nr:hypothetical protein BGX28_004592 [Mortierella sp. GBA30]